MPVAIRLMFTAALCWMVFRHAHWSVGVAIAGLCAANELNAYVTGKVEKRGK